MSNSYAECASPVRTGLQQRPILNVVARHDNRAPSHCNVKRYKSYLDYIIAPLVLIFCAPVLLAIVIAIKVTDRGPVYFRQPRLGLNNRIFNILKFRTMYHKDSDLAGQVLTTRNDPRVTPVGRFLRKTSLDELPQLFNVLAGDMSLVGPRPHALSAGVLGRRYCDIVPNYQYRHLVKPGMTGWAQVNGWRGETTEDRQILNRVEHDLEYVVKQSLWFDLKILYLTAVRVWRSQQAF